MAEKLDYSLDNVLQVVADDWTKLRRGDVFRLLDITWDEHRQAMVDRIVAERPELVPAVASAMKEIAYDRRVQALEAEGMTRSDAQAVADAEDMQVG